MNVSRGGWGMFLGRLPSRPRKSTKRSPKGAGENFPMADDPLRSGSPIIRATKLCTRFSAISARRSLPATRTSCRTVRSPPIPPRRAPSSASASVPRGAIAVWGDLSAGARRHGADIRFSAPVLVAFGKTRHVCNMASLTATCTELASGGWHMYVAYAVPIPALGDFDAKTETQHALADLREQFPGFETARLLSVRMMRGNWPTQPSCAGYDFPRETAVTGLWCVGDAVKEYGNGGNQSFAETAKLVVDQIVAARVAA